MVLNFLSFLLEIYIFLNAFHFLSPPLLFSPIIPMLPNYTGNLIFFYFPCCLYPCMSLLVSSLLSRFSEIVICRFIFLCFMSKSHLWGSIYCICLSRSWLHHSIWCFLDPCICLQISRCHYFFTLCRNPLCKHITSSLSILWSRDI